MTQSISFLQSHGARLHDLGYQVVPIAAGHKFPKGLKYWETLKADKPQIAQWAQGMFSGGGVGVLTKYCPAIDIDVLDEGIVNQLIKWCHQRIGKAPVRVGRFPKSLLVYRCETPFGKMTSKKYEDFLGEHRLEILGDGQQFVAYADHPNTGKPYAWVSDTELAQIRYEDLPVLTEAVAAELIEYFESIVHDDWAVVRKGKTATSDDGLSGAEAAFAHFKPKVDVSSERLERALSELDPDMDNDDWVDVGMALWHQYGGNSEGFELFDNWSSQGQKYDSSTMGARWQSFEADLTRVEPITAATILMLAKSAKDQGVNKLEGFLSRFVYVQDGDRVCDLDNPPHCSMSRLIEFKNATANVRHAIPAPTPKDPDKTKLEAVSYSWMVHPDRKSAAGCDYKPGEARIFADSFGMVWVNTFNLPEFGGGAVDGDLSVFHEHMDYLFPVEVEREWFIDWLAYNLQHPEQRCKVTPLHIAQAHGTGRGWVVELLGKLLGSWNITKTKMATLSGEGNGGGFNEYLHRSLVCAIEEVREGSKRYGVSDKIRDVLTENQLEVNIKFGSKKTQTVYTNFFLMSNHTDALVLSGEDRRINVFSGPVAPKDQGYYDRLYAWLSSSGVPKLSRWLLERDLSGFNRSRSMNTPARALMIESNQSETEQLFWALMEALPAPVMTFAQIVAAMRDMSEKDAFDVDLEEAQVIKLLQQHAEHMKQIKFEGKPARPWRLAKGADMSNEQIRAHLGGISV